MLAPLLACSSCFLGEEHVRAAYYISALFMLALPFLSVGGFLFWLKRSGRLCAGGAERAAAAAPGITAPRSPSPARR